MNKIIVQIISTPNEWHLTVPYLNYHIQEFDKSSSNDTRVIDRYFTRSVSSKREREYYVVEPIKYQLNGPVSIFWDKLYHLWRFDDNSSKKIFYNCANIRKIFFELNNDGSMNYYDLRVRWIGDPKKEEGKSLDN